MKRKNQRQNKRTNPRVSKLKKMKFIKLTQATTYYTPEQLSGYYDQLITAGYMTKEQAQTALDQV